MLQMIIADDDRLIRESLSRLIDWENYGIFVAAVARTGEEALHQVLSLRPDILLTDIEMPHMTTRSFCISSVFLRMKIQASAPFALQQAAGNLKLSVLP